MNPPGPGPRPGPAPRPEPGRVPQPAAGSTWTITALRAATRRARAQFHPDAQPATRHEEPMTTPPEPDRNHEPEPGQRHGREPARAPAPEPGTLPMAGRPPIEYYVVVAVAPWMRERYPDMPLSLDEALRVGHSDPEPDREAEP